MVIYKIHSDVSVKNWKQIRNNTFCNIKTIRKVCVRKSSIKTMTSQLTRVDVLADHCDVIVPVRSRLLVPEAQGVKNFVDGRPFVPASLR